MGDIAEMMLDGALCAGCGEWLESFDEAPGYPCYCATCRPDSRRARLGNPKKARNIECPQCNRLFGSIKKRDAHLLADHATDAAGRR